MPNERTGDWQPHEQLSGGSSPPVREMMDDAIHRARADAAGVDADKLVDERIAELEAAREIDQKVIAWLGAACDRTYDALAAARCWAAAWKRAASKFRAWQADTEAELELERRAVDVLARRCEQWSPPVGLCDHGTPLHVTCAACWARWARKQAQEDAAKGADHA